MSLPLSSLDRLDNVLYNLTPQEVNEALPLLSTEESVVLHTECIALAARQLEIASKVLHTLAGR
jgi:hypothetical protein